MQPWATDADILAGIRNMLRPPAPGGVASDAFSVVLAASSSPIVAPVGKLRRGWWLLECNDAWLTLRQRDSRTGPASELARSWRMGPASRLAVWVEDASALDYTVRTVLLTSTVNPTTGLQSTAAASPTLTGWWSGLERPPTDTRSGVVAYDDGSALLADRAEVDLAAPLIVYPPGWARKVSIVASSSVVLSSWDGGNDNVIGELPASRSHELAALDPWQGLRVSVAAASANVWLSWSDR